MKTLLTLLTCLFLLSPTVVLSETVDFWDLVWRQGLCYKKSSDVPFTGTVTGIVQGKIKNGQIEGPWVTYWENGQLSQKITYKDGKWDGPYVSYHKNGKLSKRETYKNGLQNGPSVGYWKNGRLDREGTYKNGKKDGPWFDYHKNGKLMSKGTYKDGKREGPWVDFHSDGTKRMSEKKTGTIIFDEGSGFYRNGKKVSD